jgi:hypothetical protein
MSRTKIWFMIDHYDVIGLWLLLLLLYLKGSMKAMYGFAEKIADINVFTV